MVEFPDDLTIRVNTGDESLTNPKKDYEFDRVYGPHIGQGKIDVVLTYSPEIVALCWVQFKNSIDMCKP